MLEFTSVEASSTCVKVCFANAWDAGLPAESKARWSSGQDGGLSRRKREFDSPTGHQKLFTPLRENK